MGGGARVYEGLCASVAVAELAVGLDSRVPERESRLPGRPNCVAGMVWLRGRVWLEKARSKPSTADWRPDSKFVDCDDVSVRIFAPRCI